jgi:hypothetical protein
MLPDVSKDHGAFVCKGFADMITALTFKQNILLALLMYKNEGFITFRTAGNSNPSPSQKRRLEPSAILVSGYSKFIGGYKRVYNICSAFGEVLREIQM